MSVAARLLLFGGLLALAFGGAAALGSAVGPEPAGEPAPHAGDEAAPHGGDGEDEQGGAHAAESGAPGGATTLPRGLAVSADGLRLVLAGRDGDRLRLRIEDARGRAVTDLDVEHERRLHLISVRRDLTAYRHVHPRLIAGGTWEARLPLREPGTHRIYADFARDGEPVTLGADVHVGGTFEPVPLPAPARTADAGDGYAVTLRHGHPGGPAEFTVTKDGRSVEDLQPHLGARGHLVALREGDLAFLHTHPDEDRLAFDVAYPSAGRYRLLLQFRHDDVVRTAAFTTEVTR